VKDLSHQIWLSKGGQGVLEKRLQIDAGSWNDFVKVCSCGKGINGRRTVEVTDHFEELQDNEARAERKGARIYVRFAQKKTRDFANKIESRTRSRGGLGLLAQRERVSGRVYDRLAQQKDWLATFRKRRENIFCRIWEEARAC
jgi:hypothetical protein